MKHLLYRALPAEAQTIVDIMENGLAPRGGDDVPLETLRARVGTKFAADGLRRGLDVLKHEKHVKVAPIKGIDSVTRLWE